MPNENKQCCPKCYGRQGTTAGGGVYCWDKNCPCHTPSQEENHSIHCECLKCFTEEPPKEEKEVLMGDFLEEMKRDISTPSQEEKMPPDAEFLNRKREEIGLNLDAPVKKNGLVGTMASLTDEQDEAIEDEASALRRNPSRDSVYLYQLIHSLLATKIEIETVVEHLESLAFDVEFQVKANPQDFSQWLNQRLSSLKQKLLNRNQ